VKRNFSVLVLASTEFAASNLAMHDTHGDWRWGADPRFTVSL